MPEPGGLYDQLYELMADINIAINTYDTIKTYQQLDRQGMAHTDILTSYPEIARFIFYVDELREHDQDSA